MLRLQGTVSGRALWLLDTKLVDQAGIDGLCNCWFCNIIDTSDFRWIMDRLMVGGGVGFSVERANVYKFPKVKKASIEHFHADDTDFIVPDTRRGWSDLIERTVQAHFSGEGFSYSTKLVRPAGAELKTFGGWASGPMILIEGVEDICQLMCERAGKSLRSTDILDIVNIIGKIVVAGSKRRSAQIAIGDPDDALFIRAKRWANGTIPAWRSNSNNTLVVDHYAEIADDPAFWRNFDGGSEPYGLFNRRLSRTMGRLGERRPDPLVEGINPCGESTLEDRGSCNLATIFLPNVESFDQFLDISRILYKVQKATALLPHPDPRTMATIHKSMRLGQNVTGLLQASDEQRSWLAPGYEALRAFDKEWSKVLGVGESIKLTVIQPGGTLSNLPGVTSGIHAAYAPFYIRRARFGAKDPLIEMCRKRGYPIVANIGLDGRPDHNQLIVEFPIQAPVGAPIASEMTVLEQLEKVVWAQSAWADQSVSVTVTFRPEELPDIKRWLAENYDDKVKAISFLPYSDHGFVLAPYEPISEEEYRKRAAKITTDEIDLHGSSNIDETDCEGGACPTR
jgi:ribonucleotide reductase alpha subunit